MRYSNEKIISLIEQRKKLDEEIEREIQKEKARYRFDWKRFSLMILCVIWLWVAIEINKHLFPDTSIWSWNYYLNKTDKINQP